MKSNPTGDVRNQKIDICITIEDAQQILGEQFLEHWEIVTNNIFCMHCDKKYDSKLAPDPKIWLNRLGDLILNGHCVSCGGRVGRYVETGETPAFFERAMQIRGERIRWS